MFGAAFIFFILIYSVITCFKNVRYDLENRKQYKNTSLNTYLSYDGTYRDLDTGKYRAFRKDKHGDFYMRGEDITEINLSQIERERKYLKGVQLEETVSFYQNEPSLIKYGSGVKRGRRYKDFKTGDIYVIRKDHLGRSYYVTLNNKVVRYTDGFKKALISRNSYDKNKERIAVNNFQKKINSVANDSFWKDDPTLIERFDFKEGEN